MIAVGRASTQYLIESPVVLIDALGAPYSTWAPFTTVFGEIEGGETVASETSASGPRRELSQSMTIICRCHPQQVFGPEQRATNVETGAIYEITAVRYDFRRTTAYLDLVGGISAGGVP